MFLVVVLGKGAEMRVPLHILHLNQDDPRKCTAIKLNNKSLARLHEDARTLPRRGLLLDPESETMLSPLDKQLIILGGSIIALDCSWKNLSEAFLTINRRFALDCRTLPSLLPANPVSWGKVGRLSSAEALAGTLSILGFWEQAKEIMRPFNFGDQFLELNKKPLFEYSKVKDTKEMREVESEFF